MPTETAKEAGRYFGPDGIPYHIAQGDQIPPGYVHEDDFKGTPANEVKVEPEGKARTKPAGNKAKGEPPESK